MVMTVEFELDGQRSRHQRRPPVQVRRGRLLPGQLRGPGRGRLLLGEADRGGEEGPCGWLKDRYGLSWQVVPTGMEELFADPDPERAERAMQAMLKMRKLDIAASQRGRRRPGGLRAGEQAPRSSAP